MVHNPRKGDGISFNVVTDANFGILTGFNTTTRGGGSQVTKGRVDSKLFMSGDTIAYDRGYGDLASTRGNHSADVKSLAMLDERKVNARPFRVISSNSAKFQLPHVTPFDLILLAPLARSSH